MTRHTPTGVILLSTLLLQASAQLLSCLDVHCPYSYGLADCHIDNTTCTEIGVASFSSSLSPNALTWTVGWAPKVFTQSTDQRRYYLGTPQGLNLNARTDITGCAFFFTGVQAGLSFVKPNGTSVDLGAESGTCADALGSTCVFDLMGQARDLAVSPDFQCTNMAQELQSSPPQSCTKPGTWGNITAKSITGPGSPPALQLDGCNPTINATYDVRSIATFPDPGDGSYINDVTPVMTVFRATGNATDVMATPEVTLLCMKPMEDLANQMVPGGNGEALAVKNSWPSALIAMIGFLATAVFMG